MNCYVCAKQGKVTPGVAVCIVCGVVLCMEHLVREELPLWEDVHAGMSATRRKKALTLPRVVCAECHWALSQRAG
jgi:hypothetical protein